MNTLLVRIVDASFSPITGATVRAVTAEQTTIQLTVAEGAFVASGIQSERVTIFVSAQGFASEVHTVFVRDQFTQVVIGLRQPGQLAYSFGSNRLAFAPVASAFLIHVQGAAAATTFSSIATRLQLKWESVSLQSGDTEVDLFVRVEAEIAIAQVLTQELISSHLIVDVSRLIVHGQRAPIGLTNELVVRFQSNVTYMEAAQIAASFGMTITREVRHAGNAYVLVRSGDISYELLSVADSLSQNLRVVYAEPNFVFTVQFDDYTPNDPLFALESPLQLINAGGAWDLLSNVAVNLRGGSPEITIAIIDSGTAPDHPEFTSILTDGTSKLVASMDFAARPIQFQTVVALADDHGTQSAGAATAAFNDALGIAGVAPNVHLLAARVGRYTDALRMADMYLWVAGFMNGSITPGFPTSLPARVADVISSSFGSNGLGLSSIMRDAFDFLTTFGRGGQGSVLLFATGNGGFVDFTNAAGANYRAWATYERTIAIGASINSAPTNPVAGSSQPDSTGSSTNIAVAADTRALYSPYGLALLSKPDLVAPSHTAYAVAGTQIDAILSTVRVGTGAVSGDYAYTFGGTSFATAIVAGAAALIMSARQSLTWIQVRQILRASAVPIDPAQANIIGQWADLDGDGVIDFSRFYGAGRLDVAGAVAKALGIGIAMPELIGGSGFVPYDVYVRDNLADTGAEPSVGPVWASPDIWVSTDVTTPVPAISYTAAGPHENPERGQDNALFVRVHNRGPGGALPFVVNALISNWPGMDFEYPTHFTPLPVPTSPLTPATYLIGQPLVLGLASGASQIVKITWQQALIPPATVMVGGTEITWHPCLLVNLSPHETIPVGRVLVQDRNNLAQRNVTIVDNFATRFVGIMAGAQNSFGVASLIIDATALQAAASIRLRIADERIMAQFVVSVRRAVEEARRRAPIGEEAAGCVLSVDEPARLRVGEGACATVIEVAAGSRILGGESVAAEQIGVRIVLHQDLETVEITGLRGRLEVPMRLADAQYVPLLVAVTGQQTGDLHLTQRRGDGEISVGYGIRFVTSEEMEETPIE